MSRAVKKLLTIAGTVILLGGIIFIIIGFWVHWDFTKFGTVDYETNHHEISVEFNDISIKTDTADVAFVLSDDGKSKVVCYEEEKVKHSVCVKEGMLTITVNDTRKWYDYIGINFNSPRITIYLPETEYSSLIIEESTGDIVLAKDFTFKNIDITVSTGDVSCYASATETIKIQADTGDIKVEGNFAQLLKITVTTGDVETIDVNVAQDVTIEVSTGDVSLSDIVCKNLISNGTTGEISLKNVIATQEISIKRSTGDVTFEGSDGAEIFVKTSTGDVTGSLLSDKVFITQTRSGDVDVPSLEIGGRCEIITNTGDIQLSVQE